MSLWDRKQPPPAAVHLVAALEDLRCDPYWDGSAAWSIGYGACRDIRGSPVSKYTPRITPAQAEALLVRDLADATASVRDAVGVPITECQAAGLIVLAYNLGSLRAAARSLCVLVNSRQWKAAANRFRIYRMSRGKPLLGLVRRRWTEAACFLGADPVQAQRSAWTAINSIDDWPLLPEPAEGSYV